jgi:hypothetical protein
MGEATAALLAQNVDRGIGNGRAPIRAIAVLPERGERTLIHVPISFHRGLSALTPRLTSPSTFYICR